MAAMKDRRPLTAEEKRAADRLKSIYSKKKAEYKVKGKKLTQEKIAGDFGWSGQTAVSQYINANIPMNIDVAIRFAKYFEVPLEFISPEFASMLPPATLPPSNTHSHAGKLSEVPLLSWVQAGAWQEVQGYGSAREAEEWILCGVPHSGNAFALKVRGESMKNPDGKPSFEDGDIVFVDPDRSVENKSLVIVQVNGDTEATFKQIIIEGERSYLKALNPNWPDRIIEMPSDSVIAGVVCGKTEII